MYLSFKKFATAFSLLMTFIAQAQDGTEDNQKPNYYYDVLGQVKIGFLVPNAYGSNFVAEGYDTWNGINLEAQVVLKERILLGLQFQAFKGRVIDQELVGPVDASGFSSFFLTAGYAFQSNQSNFQIDANIGFGNLTLRNERGFRRFNDNGLALMANIGCSYRLNYWFGFYVSLQNNWNFWTINRAQELDDIFGNTPIFAPSVGIKFYIL